MKPGRYLGIGLQPTGEKDPFALRRHALGVVRMLLEKQLPLSLSATLNQVQAQFADNAQVSNSVAEVQAFMLDRLRGLLKIKVMRQRKSKRFWQNPDDLSELMNEIARRCRRLPCCLETQDSGGKQALREYFAQSGGENETIAPSLKMFVAQRAAEQHFGQSHEQHSRPAVEQAIANMIMQQPWRAGCTARAGRCVFARCHGYGR